MRLSAEFRKMWIAWEATFSWGGWGGSQETMSKGVRGKWRGFGKFWGQMNERAVTVNLALYTELSFFLM